MDTPERCSELASPELGNFAISVALLLGILVSYLPQHIRIIRRRSSEGLSPWYILLGTIAGTCAIANILALPTSQVDMSCCRLIGPFGCAAALLGVAQVGVQWACFFVITLLFMVFIPRPGYQPTEIQTEPTEEPKPGTTSLKTAVIVVAACILHLIATFLVTVVMFSRYPERMGIWANVLGIACTILTALQYLPQIYTTWRLQHIGSLSIPMMFLQTPGAFVLAGSMARRVGIAGWSAWLVYVVAGSLQGVLLVMAIFFERRDREDARLKAMGQEPWSDQDTDEEMGHPRIASETHDEVTPLLHEQQRELAQRRLSEPDLHHPLAQHRLAPGPGSPSTTESAPIAIDGSNDDGKDKDGRRNSKAARWSKGDFSFKVW